MKLRDFILAISFLVLMFLLWSGMNIVVFVFLVPFILLALKASLKNLILWGSIAVIASGMLCLNWVHLYDFKVYYAALFVWYGFFVLFALGVRYFSKFTKNSVLIAPTLWFLFSLLLSLTSIGASWTELAMFQSMSAPLIWVVGAKGITFLIVLANSLIASLILSRSRQASIGLVCLLIVFAGCFLFSKAEPSGRVSVRVAGLQGNLDQSWEWRCVNADGKVLDTYIDMTRDVATEKPDIIVWPEYAIPDDVLDDKELRNKIESLSKDVNSCFVLGSLKWLDGFIDRKRKRNDIALVVSPNSGVTDTYVSVRPVPYDKAAVPGDRLHLVEVAGNRVGVLLCYEETLSWPARKLSEQGAEFLISLANNSRFMESKGVNWCSLPTRLRAAENGKYLIRVTNTGITQVISPRGKLVSSLEPFTRGSLIVEIKPNNRITPYSRFGDTLLLLMIFSLLALRSATGSFKR